MSTISKRVKKIKNRKDRNMNKHNKLCRKTVNRNKVATEQIINNKRTNSQKRKINRMRMMDGSLFQKQSQRRNNNQMMIWTKMKGGSLLKTMRGKWLKGPLLFRIK